MRLKKMFGTIALAGAVLTAPLIADSNVLEVSVPFAFIAGGKKLPAGNYTLRMSDSGQIVFVLGPAQSTMINTIPAGQPVGERPVLVFKRQGADEYLVGFQTPEMGSRSVPLMPLR